jgi:hypothetical protein
MTDILIENIPDADFSIDSKTDNAIITMAIAAANRDFHSTVSCGNAPGIMGPDSLMDLNYAFLL